MMIAFVKTYYFGDKFHKDVSLEETSQTKFGPAERQNVYTPYYGCYGCYARYVSKTLIGLSHLANRNEK